MKSPLKEIAALFLKLGFTAFGGPAVHMAIMQNEVVEKRKWMTEQHFLDLIGATNLIPGPNSTELAIHIGRERGGFKGLIVAGLCFIVPAVFITGIFAWLYKSYGTIPNAQPFIYGIKPAIIAIMLAAIFTMAKKSLKNFELYFIATFALVTCYFGVNEIAVLFGSGAIALALSAVKKNKTTAVFLPITILQTGSVFNPLNMKLFLSFLKIGSIIYGSGYVLFAFLDDELVKQGLLTRAQLADAIAVGQFTPGPIFSSVTFIGYQINGISGAVLATVGVFLPSFIFVALLNPLIPRMRKSRKLSEFLDAVNVASVAIIAYVCFEMGVDSLSNWRTFVIAIVSLIVCFGFRKINSALVVLGGSLLGYALSFV